MNYFTRRRIRSHGREILRQARHLRNWREDILPPSDLRGLTEAESRLRNAMEAGEWARVESRSGEVGAIITRLLPQRPGIGFRDNFDILVVAVAVAMGFRAYFLQPFKIPTGSMQPTLYGIHSRIQAEPTFFDRMPMKLLKFALFGEWHMEVRAKNHGVFSFRGQAANGIDGFVFVGGVPHVVPRDTKEVQYAVKEGDFVRKGSLLWLGIRICGDHVFVDKMRWNFNRPQRGQIVVFNTDGIPIVPAVPPGTHYIKRLVGLPGQEVGIRTPSIIVNGELAPDPRARAIAANPKEDYSRLPYYPAEGGPAIPNPFTSPSPIRRDGDAIRLDTARYLALGDNTRSSLDGRYWGAIPERNLVGPGAFVYWPFSSRWGPAR
ncbi:MAG: signal peptidase I [Verrucomicrobiota bacterium]|nr:signal peptidase I [Verrucomicrobiota bacterium]